MSSETFPQKNYQSGKKQAIHTLDNKIAACKYYDFQIPQYLYDENNGEGVYEFTSEYIINVFRKIANKWVFQLEQNNTGDKMNYYQCRISLKVKARIRATLTLLVEDPYNLVIHHITPTSSPNRDNMFYVTKEDTRISGPWMDSGKCKTDNQIPWQLICVRDNPYTYQKEIMEKISNSYGKDSRYIHCILSSKGGDGKKSIATYMHYLGLCCYIPFVGNYKDLMMFAHKYESKSYVIDIHRSIQNETLVNMFSAVENIKSGVIFDDQFSYKIKIMNSPVVWVFCNKLPPKKIPSEDRWKIWKIENVHDETTGKCDKILKSYTPIASDYHQYKKRG